MRRRDEDVRVNEGKRHRSGVERYDLDRTIEKDNESEREREREKRKHPHRLYGEMSLPHALCSCPFLLSFITLMPASLGKLLRAISFWFSRKTFMSRELPLCISNVLLNYPLTTFYRSKNVFVHWKCFVNTKRENFRRRRGKSVGKRANGN